MPTQRPATPRLPWQDWPIEDQRRWLQATQSGKTAVDHRGPMGHLGVRSTRGYASAASRLRKWAAKHGFREDAPLAELVSPSTIAAFVQDRQALGCAAGTIAHDIIGIERVLTAFGDETHRLLLRKTHNDLRRRHAPRDKSGRLQRSNRLFACGQALIGEAHRRLLAEPNSPTALVLARTGVQVALLSLRPYRLADFAGICLLEADPAPGFKPLYLIHRRHAWEICSANERTTTKRRPPNLPLPEALQPWLEWYIDDVRPRLAERLDYDGAALWVSTKPPGPLGASALYKHVVAATQRALGVAVHPHLFRDCYATSVARADPGGDPAVHRQLGNTAAVARKYYDHGARIEATLEVNTLLTEQLDEPRRRPAAKVSPRLLFAKRGRP